MLYLLPGMGASKDMYQGAWLKLPETTFINWPNYQGESSLSDVAQRVIQENGITAKDCVGGSSLGGMIALEIFKELKNPKVILLGSALNAQEIRPLLRLLAPLASFSPVKLIQSFTKSYDNLLMNMFSSSDSNFIKAMCSAASNWEGYEGDKKNILRIHGERDPVIPCPKEAEVIKNAGHLIAMTHAEECVGIIKSQT
ncbi:MAG: hypothetical protein HQM15_05430 [Deltaproteobacteria bacterium]|nr:hypothetical protein [Deltaproteobacteria bacterium]